MATTPAPDCLTSLLGLSAAGSDCFPLPTINGVAVIDKTITDSATGLYLDKVEGLSLRAASGAGGATDLYTKLGDARANAVELVRTTLEAGRAKSVGIPLFSQRGTLGGQGNGQLAPEGTRALLTFRTNYRPAGVLQVSRVEVFTDQTVTDALLLLDGVPVGTITTSAGSSVAALVVSPGALLIPLDGNQHTLEAVLPDGVRVRTNNFFAGCFSCQQGSPWSLSVKNNLRDITATTPGNGFSMSIVERCTANPDFLCFATSMEQGPDGEPVFLYPELTRYVAHAIRYKAAELFTIGLLAGKDSNRYTMLEPKSLDQLGAMYAGKATEFTAWLNSPDGLGQVKHPCFIGPPKREPGLIWTG